MTGNSKFTIQEAQMILSTIGKELENVGNLQKTLELAKTGKPTSATS